METWIFIVCFDYNAILLYCSSCFSFILFPHFWSLGPQVDSPVSLWHCCVCMCMRIFPYFSGTTARNFGLILCSLARVLELAMTSQQPWFFLLENGIRSLGAGGAHYFWVVTVAMASQWRGLWNISQHADPCGSPKWLSGKKSACQYRRRVSDPWVGKIPWSRKWQPTSVFLPGESHGQRCLAGYSP